MHDKKPRKALQRGLKALISEDISILSDRESIPLSDVTSFENAGFLKLPLKDIRANPYQPRTEFGEESLKELQDSISKHGLLEPVIVRRSKGSYELVSGERRLRAVRALGMADIPAVIREKVSDREMQILALVENQQRSDLNDLEIAMGYHELLNQFGYTHEKLAEDTGKSRSFVTNIMRLLKLPDEIKNALSSGKISSGHARALLSAHSDSLRIKLLSRIINEGLSVRQIEKMVSSDSEEPSPKKIVSKDPNISDLENRFSLKLGTKVNIKTKGNSGRISIFFTNVSDLNRISELVII